MSSEWTDLKQMKNNPHTVCDHLDTSPDYKMHHRRPPPLGKRHCRKVGGERLTHQNK